MNNLLPEYFNEFFVSTWKDIVDGKKSTHELLKQPFQINLEKIEIVEKLNWTKLSSHPELFLIEHIDLIDKNSDFKTIYLKALANDLLSENMLLPLFNKIPDKDEFYKNIKSFKTLMDCDKNGIDVWVSLLINKELGIENILPVVAWDWDVKRTNVINKTNGLKKIEFFTNNIKKWNSFFTEKTNNKNFQSKLGYRISLIKSRKNLLKPLGIKVDNSVDYAFAWGDSIKIKDLYLKQGKIKKIKENELGENCELEIIKLLRNNINYQQGNLITNQKKFTQLWFKLINKLNFSYQDDNGNLANHTFLNTKIRTIPFYLPILKNLKQNSENTKFNTFIAEDRKNSDSLFSWLNLLANEQVDMFKTIKNKCPFSQLLIHLSYQDRYCYEKFFKDDSFLINIWKNSSYEQKNQVFKEYLSDWEGLKNDHLERDFSSRYNSWSNKTIIIDILEMFLQQRLFDEYPETNESILNLLEQYTKDDLINNLFKDISIENNKAKLERTLEEKNTNTDKKLKI